MSDLKVSDVFESGIDFRLCEKGFIYCRFNEITGDALEVVEDAVTSYDSNQELIAKQAKRIKGQLKGLEVAGKVIENLECVESKLQADNELLRSQLSVPMQPVIDNRFKENKIVRYCLENSTDLNQLAMIDFSVEDREQFAQLIGYSLGGYGDLSYVTDESYYRAAELAATAKG